MSSYQIRKTPGDTAWFRHDRFGMFLHWGTYACGGRGEWVKSLEHMPDEKYNQYFAHFDPDLYDPRDWARRARAAGMKYAVLTAKHHEGFCLWDTKYTDYKSTNLPGGRDFVREYVDAFRAEGLKIGLYYSLIDWHHPDFTIDVHHPLSVLPREEVERLNATRDMNRYREYMHAQVRELLTNYGRVDICWLDFSYPQTTVEGKPWLKGKGRADWDAEALIKMARELQPGIIIDNRADVEQDLFTPEQYQPTSFLRHPVTGEYVTWEVCQTLSGSFGYARDERNWKSPEMLIQMLVETVACGGNLLMNAGPTARGNLDGKSKAALQVYADWMELNSRSIYGCTMAEPGLKAPNGVFMTQKEDGSRLYLHLFKYPFQFLELPGMAGKVEYAQFLHDGSELKMEEHTISHFSEGRTTGDDLLTIELPITKPDVVVPVVELFMK